MKKVMKEKQPMVMLCNTTVEISLLYCRIDL